MLALVTLLYTACMGVTPAYAETPRSEDMMKRPQLIGRTSLFLPKAEEIFREKYPDIDIDFIYKSISGEEVAQMLLTKDDSIDIFEVCVDYSFASLVKKGYAADLSSSSILRKEVAAMEPSIAATLMDEQGRLIAYPAELRFWSCGIHEGYWRLVFGDRPLPTNVDEMMDVWIEWELDYADEYTDMEFSIGFDYAEYCQKMITFYAQQKDTPHGLDDLNAPELRGILSKLQQIYQIRTQAGRNTKGTTAEQNDDKASIVRFRAWDAAMNEPSSAVALTSENSLYDLYLWDYTKVQLTFAAGDTPKTDGTLFVYVVNPYSRNIEAAIRYIECVSELESNPYVYYATHPECNEPYEQPDFQKWIEDFVLQKAQLEELKKTADDTQLMQMADLQAMIDYYDYCIQNQETEKWMISADTLLRQRALLGKLDLHMYSLFLGAPGSAADQMIAELCKRYADGDMSMDALLDELNGKIRIMRLENN